jgi:hypothetical protein
VKVDTSVAKTDRCIYTRIKERSLNNKSEVFKHITSCKHFQHIKSILELYPDEKTNPLKLVYFQNLYLQTLRLSTDLIIGPYCYLKKHLLLDALNLNLITELKHLKNL